MESVRVGHDWATSLSLSLSCIGEGNGNPLQCSCLENPRDGGAWWAAVYGVAQSRTQLKWLSSSSSGKEITLKITTSWCRTSEKAGWQCQLSCLHWVNYFTNTPRKWSHTAIPHRLKNNKIRLNHFFFYSSSLSHGLLKFLCSTIAPFQLFQLYIPEKVIHTALEGIYCTAIKRIGSRKFYRTVSGT